MNGRIMAPLSMFSLVLALGACGGDIAGPVDEQGKGDGEEEQTQTLHCGHFNIFGRGVACCTPEGGCLASVPGYPGDACFCTKLSGELVNGELGSEALHQVAGRVDCGSIRAFGPGAACCTPKGGCLASVPGSIGAPCACQRDGRMINGWVQ